MIFRKENDKIVNVELGVANEILTDVSNKNDLITTGMVKARLNSLGNVILNNYYNDYLVYIKKQNPDVKLEGFILPKPGSFLAMINYEKIDDSYTKYNIPILSKDAREQFVNGVNNFVNGANKINSEITASIEKLNTILPTLKLAKPVFDFFEVKEFSIFKTYDYLKENNYLTKFSSTTDINEENLIELMGVLKTNIITLNKITSDLELNEFVQTDIKNLINKDEMLSDVAGLIDRYNLATLGMNNALSADVYEETVNQKIILLAYLLDMFKKIKGKYDIGTINAVESIINFFIKNIDTSVKIINNNIIAGSVMYKLNKDADGNFVLSVYEENFNKLKDNNIKLEVLLGFAVYANSKAITPLTGTLNSLQIKADVYTNYFDAFRNNIIMTNKNNIKSKLINVYILVISEFFGEVKDLELEKIKDYLTVLPISDLQNFNDTIRNIVILFVYPNNKGLLVFFNGVKEASELLPKDGAVTELAGYATYKFILFYLAQQTTIK